MKINNNNESTLYAITPTIDYKEFYLSYHRRQKPFYIQKEKELPKLKNTTFKTEASIQDYKTDISNNYNYLKSTNSNTKTNSIYQTTDNNKTDLLNYTINWPFIKTEQSNYPKINPIFIQTKNLNWPNKTKIQKKVGKLSIKYLDIIKMNSGGKNNLIFNEINKNEKMLENEITENIRDSKAKNKIINELRNIETTTNNQIENIMKNTTKEEQEKYLNDFEIHPKIIKFSAEEIFKEFNNRDTGDNNNFNGKFKINKKLKIRLKEKKENLLNDIFLDFAKNNIRRKIELRNQFNQELSIEYIEKLLKNEIEKIKIILAIYYYYLNNRNENFSLSVDEIKNLKKNNLLKNAFNKFHKLNNYYNYLTSSDNRNLKNHLNKNNNKYFFNTIIDKNKLKNNRYKTEDEYIKMLLNQITNNSEEDKGKNNEEHNNKNNEKNTEKSPKEKSIFHLYSKRKVFPYTKLVKPISKNLDKNIITNKKNLKPIKIKNSINKENHIKTEVENKDLNKKDENSLKEDKNIKENIELNLNNQSLQSKSESEGKNNSKLEKGILSIMNENKNNNLKNDDIITNLEEESNIKNDEQNEEKKEESEIKEKNEGNYDLKEKDNLENTNEKKEENKENELIIEEENKENEKNEENEENKLIKEEENKEKEKKEENELIKEEENKYNEKINNESDTNQDNNEENKEANKNNDIKENENENEEDIKKEEKNEIIKEDNENSNSSDIISEENDNIILPIEQFSENKPLNEPKKSKEAKTNKINKPKRKEKKYVTKAYPSRHGPNTNAINYFTELMTRNLHIQKKSKYYSRKNFRNFRAINLNTFSEKKRSISPKKKRRTSVAIASKTRRSIIKNFELIEIKPKRNISEGNIKTDKSESDELNVIKLQDSDIDKIVNFVNEEEKRRLKTEKNGSRLEKEKIGKKSENNLYNFFKEKEELLDDNNLTRIDIIEKLKKDNLKIRNYIEGIIRSGLSIGDKKLNNQMKHYSILLYKEFCLGQFKFNKNFGIKDEIIFEPFRPLSGKGQKEDDKKKKNQKKEKKKEKEPKKELIFDNRYLYPKKKTIKYILRKEVEDILNGGILLQQKAVEEKEEKTKKVKKKRFETPKKKTFVKKKKNRKKLFRKSEFFKELILEDKVGNKEEDLKKLEELKRQEEIREKNLDEKIKKFMEKIKNLKIDEEDSLNIDEKIDDYINQRIKGDENEKGKKEKENRINEFLTALNDYRIIKKKQRKVLDTYLYKEPILMENKIVENYEKNDKSFISKSSNTLKDLEKINSLYTNKSFDRNKKLYSENKPYITEIDI